MKLNIIENYTSTNINQNIFINLNTNTNLGASSLDLFLEDHERFVIHSYLSGVVSNVRSVRNVMTITNIIKCQ